MTILSSVWWHVLLVVELAVLSSSYPEPNNANRNYLKRHKMTVNGAQFASAQASTQATLGTTQATPGTAQTTPGTAETTPGTTQTTPGTTQTTPGTAQTTPGTAETTPGTAQTTPETIQATPGTTQVTPETTQVTPGTTQVTPGTRQVTPGTAQTTQGTTQTTQGTTQTTPTPGETCPPTQPDRTVLTIDFEDNDHLDYFSSTPATSEISLVETHHKNGDKSLRWNWPEGTSTDKSLYLDLAAKGKTRDESEELQNGGVKFWMYRPSDTVTSTMNIIFVGKNGASASSSDSTAVTLNFKGWRAVWIGYEEFPPTQFQLTELERIKFQITSADEDSLYIDLIQFTERMGKQSRDVIVPIIGTSNTGRKPFYTEKDFWQRSLRWHLEGEANDLSNEPNDKAAKKEDINAITDRIDNWYMNTTESTKSLEEYSEASATEFDFQEAKKKRWENLAQDISNAHTYYGQIDFRQKLPTLFPKVSDYGAERITQSETKFGFMFHKILQPLSIEFNFMTRPAQKNALKEAYCEVWQDPDNDITKDHVSAQQFAGNSLVMREKFETIITEERAKPSGLVCDVVINRLNNERFTRIKNLLEFLEDQGWSEGSGLGSIDHEMNKDGSGFMHSMFLLRKELKKPANSELRDRLLKTMKWYNDFNEIYQDDDDYIYDGTTADRLRTIFLYRLFIIIIDDDNENKQINNLQYFTTWGKHALRINKGLGGLIKPDYTGFHHKTFYGVAYVPHALHNAAIVQYFLEGTNFALPDESKDNIRKSLEVMRIISVKYSTPNGLCGRFPSYNRSILAEHIPAFAYISYVHGNEADEEHTEKPAMFKRLFTPGVIGTSTKPLDEYLTNGYIKSGIYYWNTIGSLDILNNVTTLPCQGTSGCSAEPSPQGHWTKNFAALSIHRREDWSVAAKGMSKYTWDYESGKKENVLGMFVSHGSLQISNSEEALKAYDVTKGWDWRKIPGTTTFEVPFDKMRLKKARNYNHEGMFAGGVSLIGAAGDPKFANGAFGMRFIQPTYKLHDKKNNPLKKSNLKFVKSYFFYDGLIVCLGSDIKLGRRSTLTDAQTTLFQDKIFDTKTISVGGVEMSSDFDNELTSVDSPVTLEDTNGNLYKVKIGADNKLKVKISDQTTKDIGGCTDNTEKYALAYLNHENAKSSPRDYEYAIVISGGQEDLFDKYTVLENGATAHVVKVEKSTQDTIYGYAVFQVPRSLPSTGPLETISEPCMIMVEKSSRTINLAISDPVLSFEDDPSMTSKKTCTDQDQGSSQCGTLDPKTSEEVGSKLLYCVEAEAQTITVKFRETFTGMVKVKVDGVEVDNMSIASHVVPNFAEKEVSFINLKNGFSTEVQLTTA